MNGHRVNQPTRLTAIACPDTVIEAHGHQPGSPYKGREPSGVAGPPSPGEGPASAASSFLLTLQPRGRKPRAGW